MEILVLLLVWLSLALLLLLAAFGVRVAWLDLLALGLAVFVLANLLPLLDRAL